MHSEHSYVLSLSSKGNQPIVGQSGGNSCNIYTGSASHVDTDTETPFLCFGHCNIWTMDVALDSDIHCWLLDCTLLNQFRSYTR